MSKKNIVRISNELKAQGYKFLLSGIDEQGAPFYEFHGHTPESATLLHFSVMQYLCIQMLKGGASEKVLREYVDDVIKESLDAVEKASGQLM